MAEVLLFHHIQGLTDGVRSFADDLRGQGHTVHVPDLFDGHTFATISDGFAYADDVGLDVIQAQGVAVADEHGDGLVYAGFSFGVTIAQRLAQTRPGARAGLFLYSCLPLTTFAPSWPAGVPVQIHGKEGDEFFDEDLPAAREFAASVAGAELFVYPGEQHLFADPSLDAYDADAAALMMERVAAFLLAV